MGHTQVTVTFRNPRSPERAWEALCLVNGGATDCLVPAEAVEAMGLEPRGEVTVVLADERETRLQFSGAIPTTQQLRRLPALLLKRGGAAAARPGAARR